MIGSLKIQNKNLYVYIHKGSLNYENYRMLLKRTLGLEFNDEEFNEVKLFKKTNHHSA